jgi:hypothetical protein
VNLPAATVVAKRLQGLDAAADTGEVRPRLLALVLAVLPVACGGAEAGKAPAAGTQLVGTADVERLLVTTQRRRSPGLRVGTASCPDQVRLANGTRFTCTVQIEGTQAPSAVTLRDVDAAKATVRCGAARVRVVEVGAAIACTITLGDAVQKVHAVVKDLKGTVVVRG